MATGNIDLKTGKPLLATTPSYTCVTISATNKLYSGLKFQKPPFKNTDYTAIPTTPHKKPNQWNLFSHSPSTDIFEPRPVTRGKEKLKSFF